MIEVVADGPGLQAPSLGPSRTYYCNICSHEWTVAAAASRPFSAPSKMWCSAQALRVMSWTTLADIGALNAFTNERRSALCAVERAVRPAGELYRESGTGKWEPEEHEPRTSESRIPDPGSRAPGPHPHYVP
jgi:hypothetical protein